MLTESNQNIVHQTLLRDINNAIIFENENFVVVNKPAGMLTIPDREQTQISLKDVLLKKYATIFTVHRLDRETSGVVLFAKNETTHKYFSKQFEDRLVEKFYLGIVQGTPAQPTGTIDAPIMEHPALKGQMVVHKKGKPSITDYEVQEIVGKYALLKFQIHTGRTHQIRVHAKNMGHPIICDPLYGDGSPFLISSIKKKYNLSKQEEEEKPILNRVALHSYQLKCTDSEGTKHNFIAELPKDMRALLQQLRKRK